MSLDSALWYAGLALETAVVGVLLQRRAQGAFPLFFAYMVWTVLGDFAGVLINQRFQNPELYYRVYLTELPIDSLLQFGVVVELAWSVLRPIRSGLPRKMFFAVVAITLLAGLAAWPLTAATVPPVAHDVHNAYRLLYRLIQTAAIVRILFFLALAGFSHLLGVGWRDRELQVATGLGFYSLVSLGTATLHLHFPKVAHFHVLNQVVVASYLVSLIYWGISFLQKEAPRQEFNPRMRSFLLAVANAARADRIAIEELRRAPKV